MKILRERSESVQYFTLPKRQKARSHSLHCRFPRSSFEKVSLIPQPLLILKRKGACSSWADVRECVLSLEGRFVDKSSDTGPLFQKGICVGL
jgi:hypothetical protein